MGLWHSCYPLLPKHKQQITSFPSQKDLPVCSSYPSINVSVLPWPWTPRKMLSVLCSVKVSSWAVTGEERTGQKSAQTDLRPTCSRSHSLELLQDTSEPTFSSLDPLEIVLMGWNISEEDQKNSQQWYRVPISKMFSWQSTSVWKCVDAWWLISLLTFPLLSCNCESSH